VVELGDGTYAVRFEKDGASVYVRVDNDLPIWPGKTTPVYAGLGPEGAMWVAIVENAFAFFRRNLGTYESIHGGWMNEPCEVLGFEPQRIIRGFTNPTDVIARVKAELDAGAAMTFGTSTVPAGIPLVSGHAFMIDAVILDEEGNPAFMRLLNPWGTDGAGNNDGADDGYVTITAEQVAAAFVGIVFSYA
jgi:hypothetical protein